MKDALKVGDRVRVRAGTRIPQYPAGGKGTVAEGPFRFGAGRRYYLVAMDSDWTRQPVVYSEWEIEPDV
jgi:hypothetical protein